MQRRDFLGALPAAFAVGLLSPLPSIAQEASVTTINIGPGQSLTSCAGATTRNDDGYLVLPGALDVPEGLTSAGAGLMFVKVVAGRWVIQTLTGIGGGQQQWTREFDMQVPPVTKWQPQAVVTGIGNSTLVLMGDSITGFGAFVPQLQNRLGSTRIVNCGIGGTRLSYQTAQTDYCELSWARLLDAKCDNVWTAVDAAVAHILATTGENYGPQVAAFKALDLSTPKTLIANYGANDFTGSAPLGAITDTVKTTFRGAMNYGSNRLATTFPEVRVGVATPIYRSATFGAPGTFDPETMPIAGVYLHEFPDAMLERAGAWGSPALDLWRGSGINKANWANKLIDGVHPLTATGGFDLGNRYGGFAATAF